MTLMCFVCMHTTVDYVLVFVGHVESHVNPNEVDAVQWVDQAALKTMLQNGLLFSLFEAMFAGNFTCLFWCC